MGNSLYDYKHGPCVEGLWEPVSLGHRGLCAGGQGITGNRRKNCPKAWAEQMIVRKEFHLLVCHLPTFCTPPWVPRASPCLRRGFLTFSGPDCAPVLPILFALTALICGVRPRPHAPGLFLPSVKGWALSLSDGIGEKQPEGLSSPNHGLCFLKNLLLFMSEHGDG